MAHLAQRLIHSINCKCTTPRASEWVLAMICEHYYRAISHVLFWQWGLWLGRFMLLSTIFQLYRGGLMIEQCWWWWWWWWWSNPPIYNTRDEHANHYTNKVVDYLWKENQTYAKREAMQLLRNYWATYLANSLVLIYNIWSCSSLQLMTNLLTKSWLDDKKGS